MSLQCLQIIVKDTFDGITNDVLIAKWVLMQLSCHFLKKHNFKTVVHFIHTRTVISDINFSSGTFDAIMADQGRNRVYSSCCSA